MPWPRPPAEFLPPLPGGREEERERERAAERWRGQGLRLADASPRSGRSRGSAGRRGEGRSAAARHPPHPGWGAPGAGRSLLTPPPPRRADLSPAARPSGPPERAPQIPSSRQFSRDVQTSPGAASGAPAARLRRGRAPAAESS